MQTAICVSLYSFSKILGNIHLIFNGIFSAGLIVVLKKFSLIILDAYFKGPPNCLPFSTTLKNLFSVWKFCLIFLDDFTADIFICCSLIHNEIYWPFCCKYD